MEVNSLSTQPKQDIFTKDIKKEDVSTSFDEHLKNAHSIQINCEWLSDKDNQLINEAADRLNLTKEQRIDIDRHLWIASCVSIYGKKLEEYSKMDIDDLRNNLTEEMKQYYSGNDALSKAFANVGFYRSLLAKRQYIYDFHEELNKLLIENKKPTTNLQVNPNK